jgi:hypothetical protein
MKGISIKPMYFFYLKNLGKIKIFLFKKRENHDKERNLYLVNILERGNRLGYGISKDPFIARENAIFSSMFSIYKEISDIRINTYK